MLQKALPIPYTHLGKSAGTELLDSFALCLLCAAVWVPRLRRSAMMMDANPALPGWAHV